MENMLLVGLSRQMTLERQLDVVANNVANANTNGFKADKPLFQEYLTGSEDEFSRGDRRVSFDQAQRLPKEGSNLYSAGEGGSPVPAGANITVRQGFVEKSNVNAVAEMSHMIEVTRAYTQMATMLQNQSDLHKAAIEKLA